MGIGLNLNRMVGKRSMPSKEDDEQNDDDSSSDEEPDAGGESED